MFGTVRRQLAAMNGHFFGLPFPPTIIIWVVVALVLIIGLKDDVVGRNLYALGGNRRSASLMGVQRVQILGRLRLISGVFAALAVPAAGMVRRRVHRCRRSYLFTTLAAVVIGGTSLLGGNGGYGFTVIGDPRAALLTSFLLGIGLPCDGSSSSSAF